MANAPALGASAASWTTEPEIQISPELEAELAAAVAEFERGEYIELTKEQLERAAVT